MPRRAFFILILSLTLAACGDSSSDAPEGAASATPAETPTPIIEKVRGTPTPLPQVTPSGMEEPAIRGRTGKPPAQLVTRDIKRGKGAAAELGKTVTVDY